MISSVADYRFVTPQNIIIDGSPMLVRDARQDGSWKVLRGEDAAFIREAACRTSYVCKNYQYVTPHYALFIFIAPETAGICDQHILAEPLKDSVAGLNDVWTRYASDFMTASYLVQPSGDTIPEIIGKELPAPVLPQRQTSFIALKADEIRQTMNAIQQLRHPTMHNEPAQWDTDREVTDEWHVEINPTYIYNQENNMPQDAPGRRRRNLEAIYSYASRWGTSTDPSYTGSITTCWNKNRPESWYVYLFPPNYVGTQYTDRDGIVHQADDQLWWSILDTTAANAQAVLQFNVYQSIGSNPSAEINKDVYVPCSISSVDSMGRFNLDVTSMYNAAFTAMTAAGANIMTLSRLSTQQGSDSGSTVVKLRAVHGIFTLNDDLKIVV